MLALSELASQLEHDDSRQSNASCRLGSGCAVLVRWLAPVQPSAERRAAMTWAQRLKRVFNIDIETCRECGGAMKVIACIEDPVVMPKALVTLAGQALQKILNHLKAKGECQDAFRLLESHGPPQTSLFG